MYAYLKGRLTHKSPTAVYLDIGGVAYELNISLNTYAKIESKEEVRLYTYLHVKEDDLQLFGFFDEEEKQLFVQLLSVSGIGPNTARIILSSMTPKEVRSAILTENDLAFKKVKGVGPKTAKRLILDLKDKMHPAKGEVISIPGSVNAEKTTEAMEALSALGFQKQRIQKVLASLPVSADDSLEIIIKEALRRLT